MKVDVVSPDEENDSATQAPVDQSCEGQAPAAGQGSAPSSGKSEPEALDAEYEPVDAKAKKKAAEQEVFSLADLEAARKAADEANERYLRLEAEWDNFRKRTAREREAEKLRAAESLVLRLLPVVDDMERALDHAAKSQPEGEFAQFVEGVNAMHAKLADVLTKEGVEVIDPAGQAFDMHEHQAVGHVDDAEAFDETVRDVYQKGYRMGSRVIRPAMVTVTKGGPRRPAPDADEAPQA